MDVFEAGEDKMTFPPLLSGSDGSLNLDGGQGDVRRAEFDPLYSQRANARKEASGKGSRLLGAGGNE